MTFVVEVGDALDLIRERADESIDAVVTDPPAGIGFMGREWDDHSTYAARSEKARRLQVALVELGLEAWEAGFAAFMTDTASELYRVLKPGGHGLVWALPRTSDLTVLGLRLGGLEVRDVVTHHFATGFPKSRNLAGDREGWGTALKPATEHWILVRKPLAGTVEATVARHGTGAINIDASRIPYQSAADREERDAKNPGRADVVTSGTYGEDRPQQAEANDLARWPSNVVFSHTPLCRPAGARVVHGNGHVPRASGQTGLWSGEGGGLNGVERDERDYGAEVVDAYDCAPSCPVAELERQAPGAARFFFVAKPSAAERDAGLDDLEAEAFVRSGGGERRLKRGDDPYPDGTVGLNRVTQRRNTHPTVKPIELMRYLVRMVTPPGGVVLDPFTGSGATGAAAVLEGFSFVGYEQDPKFAGIARRRIAHFEREASRPADAPPPKKAKPARIGTARLDAFGTVAE